MKWEQLVKTALEKTRGYEFNSFSVGCRGVEEKAEVNRKIRNMIMRMSGKRVDLVYPDVFFLFDLEKGEAKVEIRPLFIFGRYQKLVRFISQTAWVKYGDSVQNIIGKVLLRETLGKKTSFHGMGREDVDVRCLGKRPFVIEIEKPKKRNIDLKKVAAKINKSPYVKVFDLSFCNSGKVREIKARDVDKEYCALVECFNIKGEEIKRIENVFKDRLVEQWTPSRVLHRRANRLRKRMVRWVKCNQVGEHYFKIRVKAQSGTYIKELISGDNGRTRPSFTEIIGRPCRCMYLDVVAIYD